MSDAPMTPVEESIARNERLYQTFRNANSAEGAFHRLSHEFSPSKLSLMLVTETSNGMEYDDIIAVVGQVIGNLMISVAGSTCEPRECLRDLWAVTGVHVSHVVTGQHQGGVVLVKNGHEDEVTLEGLFRETGGGTDA